jgi:hypothetical protein
MAKNNYTHNIHENGTEGYEVKSQRLPSTFYCCPEGNSCLEFLVNSSRNCLLEMHMRNCFR